MKRFLLLLALLCVGDGREDGAPDTACFTLTPSHAGNKPQTKEKSPYTVTAVKSGNRVTVTISSPTGKEFQGFVLQARSKNDETKLIDGEFSDSDRSKAIDCGPGKKNTLTHINKDAKDIVVTEWTPNDAVNEDVVFRATVAQSFSIFWTEVDSEPIRIENGQVFTISGKSSNAESMYEGCFESKGCFGLPSGCVERADCRLLLAYSRTPHSIQFEMQGHLDPSTYMAMGLSKDAVMGDDSVTECIRDGTNVIARESWNEGKTNTRTKELAKDQYSSSFANGLSSCSWTKPLLFESHGQQYNLQNNTYHILLAKGTVADEQLKYHAGERLASVDAVNFTAFEAIQGEGITTSVKVHGAFMVTAWVGFVSFAILLARHFKNTWEDSTLGGVKVWFALHRAFMISGLIFVVIAFIVIFVHKNGWNYQTDNPHAILGCIATGLGLFNPIMAAFRPAPDHRRRPIFNWFHWGVGNSAQIIAVITIFFAVSLPSSGLNNSFYWVMAVFAVIHLIFHVLFQVQTWTQRRKKSNEFIMSEVNGARSYNIQNEQPMRTNNTSDNECRMFLLGIYTMFVLAILIALYSLIGVA